MCACCGVTCVHKHRHHDAVPIRLAILDISTFKEMLESAVVVVDLVSDIRTRNHGGDCAGCCCGDGCDYNRESWWSWHGGNHHVAAEMLCLVMMVMVVWWVRVACTSGVNVDGLGCEVMCVWMQWMNAGGMYSDLHSQSKHVPCLYSVHSQSN